MALKEGTTVCEIVSVEFTCTYLTMARGNDRFLDISQKVEFLPVDWIIMEKNYIFFMRFIFIPCWNLQCFLYYKKPQVLDMIKSNDTHRYSSLY